MQKREWSLAISLITLSVNWLGYAMEQEIEDYTMINRVYVSGKSGDVIIKSVDDLVDRCRVAHSSNIKPEEFYWQSFGTLCFYLKDIIAPITIEIPSLYPIIKEVMVTSGNVCINGGCGAIKIEKHTGNVTLEPEYLNNTNVRVQNGNIVVHFPERVDATIEIYAKEGCVHNHMKRYAAMSKSFWNRDYLKIILDRGNHPVTISTKNGIVSLEENDDNTINEEKINE